MRYLFIIFCCVMIAATLITSEQPPYNLANSQRYHAEVFAVPHTRTWRGESIDLVIHVTPQSELKDKADGVFFQIVGGILAKECPSAKHASFIVMQGQYFYQYSIKAIKNHTWAFSLEPFGASQCIVLLKYFTAKAFRLIRDVLGLESLTEVRWGAGGLCVALLLVTLFIPRRRRKTAPCESNKSEPPRQKNIQKEAQNQFLVYHSQFSQRYSKALATPYADNDPVQAGDYGEARVLQEIAAVGGGVVYWGLGLSNDNKKCEMDILVVAPHAVLHVEVKNLRGTWESKNFSNEDKKDKTWQRLEDRKVLSKSPVDQAYRARDMLGKAVDNLCKILLPIHSVVVMANENFQFTGDEDDGVAVMSLKEFIPFYQDFAHGSLARLQAAKKGTIGALIEYIAGYGQKPSFFDIRMFEDQPDDLPDMPLQPGTFEDVLRHYLDHVWGLDCRIPKHDKIWFGDKDDMAPHKS